MSLIQKENLSFDQAYTAFKMVLDNEVTDMQQGAFLASLTAKGETAEEVAGGWKAIYECDTNKVTMDGLTPVDNSGTGMDSFKTFNISTAASIVAAAGGVTIARHGARAITSSCGTVDMAEMLGVDVECPVEIVAESIKEAGIGLFNGMSPQVHPMALGRILSQICFGSPLNIAASLAHPALPRIGVRGVYAKSLLQPVAQVMKEIGYTDALVIYGEIDNSEQGMDEGSVCGPTEAVELRDGKLRQYSFRPEDCGLPCHTPEALSPDKDPQTSALRMYRLLAGREEESRTNAILLNSGLIFYVRKMASTIEEGVKMARDLLQSGKAIGCLEKWVELQNSNPTAGRQRLNQLKEAA